MQDRALWAEISRQLGEQAGAAFAIDRIRRAGGGSISQAVVAKAVDGGRLFVKLNDAGRGAMFAAEAAGLGAIRQTGTIRVPEVIGHGVAGDRSYLALEHLPLAPCTDRGAARLGRALAAMHRHTHDTFGWDGDNTIGSTPQPNGPLEDWAAFWGERRLGFQLSLAVRAGYRGLARPGEALVSAVPALLAGHKPPASLLHGDLWSGNQACLAGDEPVVFDPAVYWGDRETDLAMTRLFGAFPEAFYAAYNESWPLAPGHAERQDLYNLYHVLNHLNLFGATYLGQARAMIERLLARAR